MNSTKSLNIGGGGRGRMSLNAAARQLGISQDELGGNAEGFWEMLNDMSENNPEEYKKFIAEQMNAAKEEQGRKGFRPSAGFTIKTTLMKNGEKIFVNCCSFEGVDMPQDALGNPVKGDAKVNLAGLNIPIAISPIRACHDNSGKVVSAVDAIFNPWVIQQASEFSSFHSQVVELALQMFEDEHKDRLSRKYKRINSKYKGYDKKPSGENVEALYPVESGDERVEEEKAPQAEPKKTPAVISSPQDILHAMREDTVDNEKSVPEKFSLPQATVQQKKETVVPTQQKPLIEPIEPEKKKEPELCEKKTSEKQSGDQKKGSIGPKRKQSAPKTSKPVVKAGFLHNATESIYGEEGSREAKPTSIYQRSQIVDLNNMSEEEARKVMEQHAKGPTPKPKAKNKPPQSNSSKEMMDNMNLFQETLKGFSSSKGPDNFAKLAEMVDSELGLKNVLEASESENVDQLTALLGDMAKTLTPSTLPTSQENEQNRENGPGKDLVEKKPTPVRETPKYTLQEEPKKLSAIIHLPKIASLMDVDVEISEQKIRLLQSEHYAPLTIKLPYPIDKDASRAKFSKKTGKLTLKLCIH